MKICPKCKAEYEDRFRFCHQCGTPLEEVRNFCVFCKSPLEKNNRFCPFCGKEVVMEKENLPAVSEPLEESEPVTVSKPEKELKDSTVFDTDQIQDTESVSEKKTEEEEATDREIFPNEKTVTEENVTVKEDEKPQEKEIREKMTVNSIKRRVQAFFSLENLFVFYGRISRLDFLLIQIFLFFFSFLLTGFLSVLHFSPFWASMFPALLCMYPYFCSIAKRLHDIGISGKWAGLFVTAVLLHNIQKSFTVFIVLVVLLTLPYMYLFLYKGTEGRNRYGNDPLGSEG